MRVHVQQDATESKHSHVFLRHFDAMAAKWSFGLFLAIVKGAQEQTLQLINLHILVIAATLHGLLTCSNLDTIWQATQRL